METKMFVAQHGTKFYNNEKGSVFAITDVGPIEEHGSFVFTENDLLQDLSCGVPFGTPNWMPLDDLRQYSHYLKGQKKLIDQDLFNNAPCTHCKYFYRKEQPFGVIQWCHAEQEQDFSCFSPR